MKGVVASGHKLTSQAAASVLEKGGNAFDAAVAAAFAATVTEPCLTSLGGGGFMLVHKASERTNVLYDFFVNAPGQGCRGGSDSSDFLPIDVNFGSTVQVFHAGSASVAVPGMLKGLLECQRDLCTMEMSDLIAPAVEYLADGVHSNPLQDYLTRILEPILTISDYGKEIYRDKIGGTLYNPLYREFLLKGPALWEDAFSGAGAEALERVMQDAGGPLTATDMRTYEVIKKEPLRFFYRAHELLTNPAPSYGGSLLRLALRELEAPNKGDMGAISPSGRLAALTSAMDLMNRSRSGVGGTTHISVMDAVGNAASLTSSNGSNSGVFLADTGVMLNNMMGEDDLHPDGFHAMAPGARVGSMMSPAFIMRGDDIYAVLGSGGSKRIRSAMLQVVTNLLDLAMDVEAAVEAPRAHLDDEGVLQLEPGFYPSDLSQVEGKWALNLWERKDLYFGGAHVVMADGTGWGDSRRGGHFISV